MTDQNRHVSSGGFGESKQESGIPKHGEALSASMGPQPLLQFLIIDTVFFFFSLRLFPFSGVVTANHRFAFYPIFCISYSDYLHVLLHCVHKSPLRPTDLVAPSLAFSYQRLLCPSSAHVQTVSIWPLWLFLQTLIIDTVFNAFYCQKTSQKWSLVLISPPLVLTQLSLFQQSRKSGCEVRHAHMPQHFSLHVSSV